MVDIFTRSADIIDVSGPVERLSGYLPLAPALCYSTDPITRNFQYTSVGGTTRTVFIADATPAAMERIKELQQGKVIERSPEEVDRYVAEVRRKEEEKRKAEEKRKEEAAAIEAAREEYNRKAAREIEAAKWREWTSNDGKPLFYARFNGLINGKAILKKKDGTMEYIALETLSLTDRNWIANYLKRR